MHRGKLVILLMLVTGMVMAGYAWWHEYRSNRRAREFWGPQSMLAISRGEPVQLLLLQPVAAGAEESASTKAAVEQLEVGGQQLAVTEVIDISRRPGLLHPRYALTDDNSYDWSAGSAAAELGCEPQWQFAIRIGNSTNPVTVLFDGHCNRIWWLEGDRGLTLVPVRAAAFRKKRDEWSR